MNRSPCHPLRLLLQKVFWFWAGRCRGLARVTLNVSYPSPATFYLPGESATHQGFFREQNLDVKLLVARGLPLRSVFLTALEPCWMADNPQAFGGRTV